jgi:hypothetical protein
MRHFRAQPYSFSCFTGFRHYLSLGFDRAAGIEPRVEAACQSVRFIKIMIAEHLRHTGA